MNNKSKKKPNIRIRKNTQRGRPRKITKRIDKTKLAFLEIRKDFKKLKKSKQRMQFLWYRTKKEHIALIKDLENRLKAIKADIKKNKAKAKPAPKKAAVKALAEKKRLGRKPMKEKAAKKTSIQKPTKKRSSKPLAKKQAVKPAPKPSPKKIKKAAPKPVVKPETTEVTPPPAAPVAPDTESEK